MRSRIALVLAVASLFGLAACGDSKSNTDGTADATTTTAPAVAKDVAVTVTDGITMVVTPGTVEAGLVKFNVTNSGKSPAEVLVLKLDAGKTAKDLADAIKVDQGAPPTWVKISGGTSAHPGESATFETIVDEGTWGIVVPPDADTKAAGRSGVFTVTASMTGGAVSLPATDASIGATEYSYDIKGLKAGKNRITVKNTGGLPHIMVVFGLKPDGKLDDVLNFQGQGQPPGTTDYNNNLSYLDPGKSGILEADLAAGRYGIACFLDNAPGGKTDKPHFMLGMKQEFTVA